MLAMMHRLQPLQACQKEFEGQILAAWSSPCRSSFQKPPVPHISLAMAMNHHLEHTYSIWTVSIPQRNVYELFRDHRQLAALSAFCVVQAVLHTPNLPLLGMIVVGSLSPSQSTSSC